MKASIIICTYNKPNILYATLNSFLLQENKNEFEIIICDDGSEDKMTLEQISNLDLNINYIELPHKGRAAARNKGLEKASGNIIIFSDDDSLIEEEFVSKHIFLHSQYDQTVVLGNRKQVYLDDKDIGSINGSNYFRQLAKIRNIAKNDIYSYCTKPIIFKNNPSSHWLCSTTGNMSIKRNFIENYGGFDENFSGWGFEDIELGYRFSKNGINFYYDENLINYHMEHARNKKDMIAEMQRNITYFYEKYNCSTDIKLYWDYFRGEISLEEFDSKTFNELGMYSKKEYFYLFKRSHFSEL